MDLLKVSYIRKSYLIGLLVLVILISLSSFPTDGAIAASHSHVRSHQNDDRRSPSREREYDGAYSPRDKSHFESSDGQGHRSEFDHESILGKFLT